MREITLNGYITEDVWMPDEFSPDDLHRMLYAPGCDPNEDVHITINSYGGECNAAVRMHDDLVKYPGKVNITISGTAASAATVLVQAADYLEMTEGSLFMIHDPAVMAFGNERDMLDTIKLLQCVKQSILNIYEKRCKRTRDEVSAMMSATTWMDASEASENGFVDAVAKDAKDGKGGVTFDRINANRETAETLINAWHERRANGHRIAPSEDKANTHEAEETPTQPEFTPAEANTEEGEQSAAINDEAPAEKGTDVTNNDTEGIMEDDTAGKVSADALEKRLSLLNIQII